MSAEMLREAAARIRGDWPVGVRCPDECRCNENAADYGSDYHPEADFHLAVADWLDAEARADVEARSFGGRGKTADSPSIKVAAAYLGRQS